MPGTPMPMPFSTDASIPDLAMHSRTASSIRSTMTSAVWRASRIGNCEEATVSPLKLAIVVVVSASEMRMPTT